MFLMPHHHYTIFDHQIWSIHHGVTRMNKCGKWVITQKIIGNSLWPGDAIWRHKSVLTLAQVIACCLMAPSLYMNQCWLIIGEVLWHSPEGSFTVNTQDIYLWYELSPLLSLGSFSPEPIPFHIPPHPFSLPIPGSFLGIPHGIITASSFTLPHIVPVCYAMAEMDRDMEDS